MGHLQAFITIGSINYPLWSEILVPQNSWVAAIRWSRGKAPEFVYIKLFPYDE